MFSEEKMLALAANEASATVPSVPFRLPGGEAAALDFFEGFLDFYTATSNKARSFNHTRDTCSLGMKPRTQVSAHAHAAQRVF